MTHMSEFELRTMPGFWRQYDQLVTQMAFKAQATSDTLVWQETLREVVLRLLGGPGETCDLDTHFLESRQDKGFQRDLIVIQTQPGEYMPCYMLVPSATKPPYKPIIALHGHGTWGARSIAGVAESPNETEFINRYHAIYAQQLALQGYLVFAPVLRGFAERLEDDQLAAFADTTSGDIWLSSCKPLSLNAMLLGKTLLGLRVWDIRRLTDYILTRLDIHQASVGCVGFSGGGTLAMFSAALDHRISCTYISGSLNTFRASIMSMDHCLCNYVPGILQYAEMGDVAALIAPRPLYVESGRSDPIFPLEGVHNALEVLKLVYHSLEADSRLASTEFEGEHRWDGRYAMGWFDKWL